jgi:hypothetical protein
MRILGGIIFEVEITLACTGDKNFCKIGALNFLVNVGISSALIKSVK